MNHLHSRSPERLLQAHDVWHHELLDAVDVVLDHVAFPNINAAPDLAVCAMRVSILHIDNQEGGVSTTQLNTGQSRMQTLWSTQIYHHFSLDLMLHAAERGPAGRADRRR